MAGRYRGRHLASQTIMFTPNKHPLSGQGSEVFLLRFLYLLVCHSEAALYGADGASQRKVNGPFRLQGNLRRLSLASSKPPVMRENSHLKEPPGSADGYITKRLYRAARLLTEQFTLCQPSLLPTCRQFSVRGTCACPNPPLTLSYHLSRSGSS